MIEARQTVEIRSSVEAVIESVKVTRGSFVAKGQVIVTLESGVFVTLPDDAKGIEDRQRARPRPPASFTSWVQVGCVFWEIRQASPQMSR